MHSGPAASRWSGLAAVAGGFLVGALLMLLSGSLPTYLGHTMWRPYWSFSVAWVAFFGCSCIEDKLRGPLPADSIAAVLNCRDLGAPGTPVKVRARMKRMLHTRPSAAEFSEVPHPGIPNRLSLPEKPATWELATLVFLVVLLVWWW